MKVEFIVFLLLLVSQWLYNDLIIFFCNLWYGDVSFDLPVQVCEDILDCWIVVKWLFFSCRPLLVPYYCMVEL